VRAATLDAQRMRAPANDFRRYAVNRARFRAARVALALLFSPQEDPMRILVAYATRHGQTEKIARRIAAELGERGHSAELCDLDGGGKTVEPSLHHAVIVAAPIHAGGYPPAVVSFLRREHARLNALPSAFVSVGLAIASKTSDGRAQTLPHVEKLCERAGFRPAHVELVAGALKYSEYGFLLRYVMRKIAAHEGGDTDTSRDYEYTDWVALAEFTRAFLARLASAHAAA
jgi:menaquinone-dependent protoporphyrinogen oxidase